MKEFLTRAIAGIIMVLLIIFTVLKGGNYLSLFIFFISIVGIREFYNAFDNLDGISPIKYIGYLSTVLFLINNLGLKKISLDFIIFITTIILLFRFVFNRELNISDIAVTLLGIIYVPFFFQHIVYLDGYIHIWLIFIISWGTDTFAYLAGNLFGRTKLIPKISPNKTIEGSLGGILGSLVLTYTFSKVFSLEKLPHMLVLAIICSIIAQLGDLTASRIKRITGIKDFGYIIPGHGGILDRFDSILFVGPCLYYFMKFLII